MRKAIGIGLVVLLTLAGLYWLYRRERSAGCPPPRNANKFPVGWKEENRPSGDLYRLAEEYADPILGPDTNYNGSVVGGFFKGIDVYPSEAAARYYEPWLVEYLESNDALPWWNIEQGEFLCLN